MFISIKFEDEDGTTFYEPINVGHISRIAFINRKNVDQGCKILMRTGDEWYTPETMDQLAPRIKGIWEEAAAVLLTQIAMEYAEAEKPKRKTRAKR